MPNRNQIEYGLLVTMTGTLVVLIGAATWLQTQKGPDGKRLGKIDLKSSSLQATMKGKNWPSSFPFGSGSNSGSNQSSSSSSQKRQD